MSVRTAYFGWGSHAGRRQPCTKVLQLLVASSLLHFGLLMAAPLHGKPAHAQDAASTSVPGPASAALPSSLASTALQQAVSTRLASADCKSLALDPASLTALLQTLRPLGLGIRVLGCPMAPAPIQHRVLAVTVIVVDGDKAADTVRGALADGQPVDMGTAYRPERWQPRSPAEGAAVMDDGEFSPDVQFNRRWLRSVMASQGYASVTGPWWAFIPVPQRRR